MDPIIKLTLLLLFFRIACASTVEKNFEHCETVVKNWASSALHQGINKDKHTLQDLLFFLHVPRTGGRSYYHCFLKKLYPSSQECPRSYDKLRFDPRKEKCRLLATHDDYSMMEKLPKERTSVVTIVRNPVDRVFSSYEFSVEVAARFLVHPDLASATKMSKRLRAKKAGVSTLDIWPWKYLVPWMRADLFARRHARRQKGSSEDKIDSPYDMKDILMPLQEFIDDPIVRDIVHNGATFQIAGLTNNSYLDESHEIRHCVREYKSLGQHVLRVAKTRLDAMLYVGLTAEHKESATMFANVVGSQVISQLRDANFSTGTLADNQSANSSSLHLDSELESNVDQNNSTLDEKALQDEDEAKRKNMTVTELIEVYEGCISSLLKTQSRRRFASLKRISPANFSKEARRHVSDAVLQEIRTLNYLDVDLFKYAQEIFAMRQVQLMGNLDMKDGSETKLDRARAFELWRIPLLVMLFILLLVLFLLANARRRVSKVKV
ncbi:protein-tyrosine sulfotransferase-like isoform X1 [Cucurbita maxima]|uniref:Sulfotransferase n=1 Tax=Cucurbita maxima TaxID=3661 RepID=A0A6J1I3I6_CUCMA|nr:protein-tyrosine sulfotransferase-like isoform X1 [Cucurbita maxima]XP_022970309.1 protein-tyrosine sulfotransferase-like isoform X1 [Cucurbita maxima]